MIGTAGRRVLGALGAAVAGALVCAVALAILDLYLSGHGIRPLGDRALVDLDALGVHLSAADAILLLFVLATVVVAARIYRK